jgi:two-component system cell cycle sensor histidine kinase/response regulator CckA
MHAPETDADEDDRTLLRRELAALRVRHDDLQSQVRTLHEQLGRQQALENQLRQLQRMELVGRLSSGLAHNFNNILMTIGSHADLALMQLPPGDPLRESLEQILAATTQATTLTRGLVSMSRRHPIKIVALDLSREIGELRKLTVPLLGRNIDFVVDIAPGLPPWFGDSSTLQQVLMNLVLNARDAMLDGGTIRVQVGRTAPIDAADGRRQLELVVADDGHGMDEATKQRLFEPFFTTKGPDKGAGLGLSTVYSLVSQFGGSIAVDSAPGRGATFRILLPYHEADPSSATIEPGETKMPAGDRVVLVDDDALVRRPLELLLRRAGFHVTAYGSGVSALEALGAGEPFEILVTDVVMPGLSGVQMVAELATRGIVRPTVFVSGHHDEEDLRAGELPPNQRFLAKPFSADELVGAIRSLLSR